MSDSTNTSRYSLYHFQACPFCMVTRAALKQLPINVEQRDVQKHPAYRSELIREGGKSQVPCLKIESQGKVRWLYESQDIIRYLNQQAQSTEKAL